MDPYRVRGRTPAGPAGLHDLVQAARTTLSAAGHPRHVRRSAPLFRQGDAPDGLHLITAGHVVVQAVTADGHDVTFAVLGPGEIIGEMAVLYPAEATRSSTVVALSAVETLVVAPADLSVLRRSNPEIDDVLLALMAERIRRLSDHLLETLHTPADKRVVRRLIVLGRVFGTASGPADAVPLTQAQLASLAGTTRQTVNQVLRTLEAAAAVRLTRAEIAIVDWRTVRTFAR